MGPANLAIERACAEFIRLRSAIALRARHGYGFGVTRVSRHHDSPACLLLATLMVPVIMILRIGGQAARSPDKVLLAIRARPALALLCAAGALGEGAATWAARNQR